MHKESSANVPLQDIASLGISADRRPRLTRRPATPSVSSSTHRISLSLSDAPRHTTTPAMTHHNGGLRTTIGLAFRSIGVIYGDVSIVPLFLFSTVFHHVDYSDPTALPKVEDVLGVTSMVFWVMTIVLLIKYVLLLLWADDRGEGGTLALFALICRRCGLSPSGKLEASASELDLARTETGTSYLENNLLRRSPRLRMFLAFVVLVGASLVIGDGILVPAIAVLSAVEGIKVPAPGFAPFIVPVTCVIVLFVFAAQRYGISIISVSFAPIVLLWLLTLGMLGIYNIVQQPAIFGALSPVPAINYFVHDPSHAYDALGSILLCVAGVEYMYADLGHFGRAGVQLGAAGLAYPALLLSYLGQGAVLLSKPEAAYDLFWYSVPSPLYVPVLVLATLAAVVGSQATISATFSIVYQAMSLDCFPRLPVSHTSRHEHHHIYIPLVNYVMCVCSIVLVIAFQSHHSLAAAFGVAVAGVMLLSDVLFVLAIILVFQLSWVWGALYFLIFGVFDTLLLSAALAKVLSGGWLPIILGILVSAVMVIWRWGESKHRDNGNKCVRLTDLLEPWVDPSEEKGHRDSTASSLLKQWRRHSRKGSRARHSVYTTGGTSTPDDSSPQQTRGHLTSAGPYTAPTSRAVSFIEAPRTARSEVDSSDASDHGEDAAAAPLQQTRSLERAMSQKKYSHAQSRSNLRHASYVAPTEPVEFHMNTIQSQPSDFRLQVDIPTAPLFDSDEEDSCLLPRRFSASGQKQSWSTVNDEQTVRFETTSVSSTFIPSIPCAIPQLADGPRFQILRHRRTNHPIPRTLGTAFFYTTASIQDGVPRVFRHFLHRFGTAPSRVVFVHLSQMTIPYVGEIDRVRVDALPIPGFYAVEWKVGYMDVRDNSFRIARRVMRLIRAMEGEDIDAKTTSSPFHDDFLSTVNDTASSTVMDSHATFVVARESVYPQPNSSRVHRLAVTFYRWLYALGKDVDVVDIPHSQVVEVGMRVII